VSGHAVLANRRALALLGCLSVQRVAVAAIPVALIVTAAARRGYGEAAAIQGVQVAVSTFTSPFRARLLDRVGRHRVIVPQTLLASTALVTFGITVITPSVPLPVVLAIALVVATSGPATDSVIRTLWRTIGKDEEQVKALHSYDSILEEVGFLIGPALASVLMLTVGQSAALFTIMGALIGGYCLILLSSDVRGALRPKPGGPAMTQAAPAGGRARRLARTLAGPIASRDLQRIVVPLILMGSVFGVVAILAPALCAAGGHSDDTGFLMATISLGGVIGALAYSAAKITLPLRTRHAVLGLVFGVPLAFGFLASSPWTLGVLLALGGLAVTPLYINAYLMMDAEIPGEVIHEANTWVPVGNNVGYVAGITIAGTIAGRHDTGPALVTVSALAIVLVAYSAAQLARPRRQGSGVGRASGQVLADT
jgi:hypothetical protein